MIYTLDEIRQRIIPVAQKYNIPAVYIFGSYARGEATEHSDIDLLIDTNGTNLKSMFALGALYNDLETALDKQIDMVTVSSLNQKPQMPSDITFRENVHKERMTLYHVA